MRFQTDGLEYLDRIYWRGVGGEEDILGSRYGRKARLRERSTGESNDDIGPAGLVAWHRDAGGGSAGP